MLGTIGAVGLGLAGDLIGNKMQQSFNAKEAQINRDWQTDMSNTAYQRAATDLDAAGLNRILALGSPASTPSGATASIEAPKLGATGIAAASAKAQIEQMSSQAKLTKAMEKTEVQKEKTEVQKEKTEEQKARLTKSEADKAALFKEPMEHFAPLVSSTAKGAADFASKSKESMGHRVEELKDIFEIAKDAPEKAKSALKSLWDKIKAKFK